MATKITFRSRKDAVDVFGEDKAQAEQILREYLGETYGGLEMSERANAEQYYASSYNGSRRGVALVATQAVFNGDEEETVEYELGFRPASEFI